MTVDSHEVVSHNGYLYSLGGVTAGGVLTNAVLVARINPDGTLGAWTPTTSFATARFAHQAAAHAGFMYVFGGATSLSWSGNPSVILSDVQVAPINADGSLGAWTTTTSLPVKRLLFTAEVHNGFLIVLGGWSGSGMLNDAWVARINPNGTLGAWTSTTPFMGARHRHRSTIQNGRIYIAGGYGTRISGSTGFIEDVQYAPVAANGTVGAWTQAPSIAQGLENHRVTSARNHLYVSGGANSSGTVSQSIEFSAVAGNGMPGPWGQTTPLPVAPRGNHGFLGVGGSIYVLGGFTPGVHSATVHFACTSGGLYPCNASSCPSGCCSEGACVSGTSNSSCGTNGVSCVACGTGQTCVAQTCSQSGLVTYYRMEESSGLTVADSSGRGNTATAAGATIVPGKVGRARWFDGNDDVSANSNYPDHLLTTMTLTAWVYPVASATWRPLLRKGANGALNYRIELDPNNYVNLGFDNLTTYVSAGSTVAIPTGTWTHLAFTYDGATMRLYINGVENTSQAMAGPPKTSSTQVLYVGRDYDMNRWFLGALDEVKLFNRALSAAEVAVEAQ